MQDLRQHYLERGSDKVFSSCLCTDLASLEVSGLDEGVAKLQHVWLMGCNRRGAAGTCPAKADWRQIAWQSALDIVEARCELCQSSSQLATLNKMSLLLLLLLSTSQ